MASGKRHETVLFVRCSPKLKAKLEEQAKENHRTVSQEVRVRLERSLRPEWRRL